MEDRKRVLLTGNWNARPESDWREEHGANFQDFVSQPCNRKKVAVKPTRLGSSKRRDRM